MLIAVGRQLGSHGCEIAQKLAKDFGLRYYDTELINMAAERCGFNPHIFEKQDENRGALKTLFGGISGRLGHFHGSFYGNPMSQESLFQIQSEAIWKAAKEESWNVGAPAGSVYKGCVFVGRCADYILRKKPDLFTLFITANDEDRVKVVADQLNCDAATARKYIQRKEAERASYYNYYTSKSWGEAQSYDLCVNSSILGVDKTAQLIETVIKEKMTLR